MIPATIINENVKTIDGDSLGMELSPYELGGSLLFGSERDSVLKYTQKAGNRRTYTLSFWVYRSAFKNTTAKTQASLINFGVINSGTAFSGCNFGNNGGFNFAHDSALTAGDSRHFQSAVTFPAVNKFYHVHIQADSTQSRPEDRLRVTIDGDVVPMTALNGDIPLNSQSFYGLADKVLYIGQHRDLTSGTWAKQPLNGAIFDFGLVDGETRDVNEFGYRDTHGVWRPRKVDASGWTGDNSFFLSFPKPVDHAGASIVELPAGKVVDGAPLKYKTKIKDRGIAFIKKTNDGFSNVHMVDSTLPDVALAVNEFASSSNPSTDPDRPVLNSDMELEFHRWYISPGYDINVRAVCFEASPEKGFDIIDYIGNATDGHRIPHNLGAEPEFMFVVAHGRNGASKSHHVYVKDMMNNHQMFVLNNDTALYDFPGEAAFWNKSAMSETHVALGPRGSTNRLGEPFKAYVFASVPGYSKMVTQTLDDGPQRIELGFRPRFLLFRFKDTAYPFSIIDTVLGSNIQLGSTVAATAATNVVDIDDTGFSYNHNLGTSQSMFFACFADETGLADAMSDFVMEGARGQELIAENPESNLIRLDYASIIQSTGAADTKSDLTDDGTRLARLDSTAGDAATRIALNRELPASGKWYLEAESCHWVGLGSDVYAVDDGVYFGVYDSRLDAGHFDTGEDGVTTSSLIPHPRRRIGIKLDMDERIATFTCSDGAVYTHAITENLKKVLVTNYHRTNHVNIEETDATVNLGQRPFGMGLPSGYRPIQELGDYTETVVNPANFFEARAEDGLGTHGLQAIPSKGAIHWEFFEASGKTYALLANRRDDTSFVTESSLYWYNEETGEMVKRQDIHSDGAAHWSTFVKDGKTYVLFSQGQGGTGSVSLYSFDEDLEALQLLQTVPELSVQAAMAFHSGNETYVVAAIHGDGVTTAVDSKMYTFDPVAERITEDQIIPTLGAIDWKTFVKDGIIYVLLANLRNDADYTINSTLFEFNLTTKKLDVKQQIATSGAIAIDVFTSDDTVFALVASHTDGTSTYPASSLYEFSTVTREFSLIQTVAADGAYDWTTFQVNDTRYCMVARRYTGSSYKQPSILYRFDSASKRLSEIQQIPALGCSALASHTMGDKALILGGNFNDDTSHEIDSVLYEFRTDIIEAEHSQNFATEGAVDWTYFNEDGVSYAVQANYRKDDGSSPDSFLYEFNPTTGLFTVKQTLTTEAAQGVETFTVAGERYLLVANHWTGATYEIDSFLFKWNRTTKEFTKTHDIPTSGATGWKVFVEDDITYALVANHAVNGGSTEANSELFIWNTGTETFDTKQQLPTVGAFGWETFVADGVRYFGHASHRNGLDYSMKSKIYRWDAATTSLVLHQEIPVVGGRGFAVTEIDDRIFACFTSPGGYASGIGGHSKLLEWDHEASQFRLTQVLPSLYAAHGTFMRYGDEAFLIIPYWEPSATKLRATEIYRYNHDTGEFEFHNSITATGVYKVVPFHHESVIYLLFAEISDGTSLEINSRAFYWHQANGRVDDRKINFKFKPDLVWMKSRDEVHWWRCHDSLRPGTAWYIDDDGADNRSEAHRTKRVAFDKGFYPPPAEHAVSRATEDYVYYGWKAAPELGLGMVQYIGNATGQSIPHGCGGVPDIVITKPISTTGNALVHAPEILGEKRYMPTVNSDAVLVDGPLNGHHLGSVNAITVSVEDQIDPINSANRDGVDYVMYTWRSIPGLSKFGKYTGNGNAEGPFIQCDFRPALIIRKAITEVGNWHVYDAARDEKGGMVSELQLSSNAAEATQSSAVIARMANGFKITTAALGHNTDNIEYLYMAFAENPFNHSSAT